MDPRTPVIVGVGLSDYPRAPHLSALGHVMQASHRALSDAHLQIGDVTGFMCTGAQGPLFDDVVTAAEFIGIRPTYVDGSMTGGSSAECVMGNAMNAIASGATECVLIAYGSDLASNKASRLAFGSARNGLQAGTLLWDSLWGHSIISSYAMIAKRHMYEYGTSLEQMAEVAMSARLHAARNPNASLRAPLTPAEAAASTVLADPLRIVDCCLVNDGGGALVLTTWERARDLPGTPIFPLASAMSQTHWTIGQMDDMTTTGAAIAGPRALAMSGRSLGDIDVVQTYDSFTITAMMMLEGLGFCGRGESGPFIADGKLRPGGALPMNTDGGALANSHPGMRGIFLLIEAVHQLRGDAGTRQTPGARTALVCGSGGIMSVIGVVVLGKDPR
jgi:acetyl-CoA acetyltransferase